MKTSQTPKSSWQNTHKLATAVSAFFAAAIIPGAAVLFSAAPPAPPGNGGGNPNQPSPAQRDNENNNNQNPADRNAADRNNMNANQGNQANRDRPANAIESTKLEFQTWTKIKGQNLYTKTDDKDLGNIEDALISRGTGRIDYLVVKTGATLGMGGKQVLVPYDQISLKTGERHEFRSDTTQDQLKGMTEFSEKSWKDRNNAGGEKEPLHQTLSRQPANERQDPYANNINTNEKAQTIEGKVTDVSRRNINGMEQVVITVQDNAGKKQEVNLGPSWFAATGDASPQRGQQVTVHTLKTRDGNAMLVATSVSYGQGKDVRYREDTGKAAWTDNNSKTVGPSRYFTANELVGKDVDTQDGRLGTVEHLIVECNSGEVAFVSIDPDRNFLGIGDTKRLVPFEIVTFQPNGHIGLDATKEMVLASRQTPKNLEDLRSDELRSQVFKSFDIQPQTFIARERSEWK